MVSFEDGIGGNEQVREEAFTALSSSSISCSPLIVSAVQHFYLIFCHLFRRPRPCSIPGHDGPDTNGSDPSQYSSIGSSLCGSRMVLLPRRRLLLIVSIPGLTHLLRFEHVSAEQALKRELILVDCSIINHCNHPRIFFLHYLP